MPTFKLILKPLLAVFLETRVLGSETAVFAKSQKIGMNRKTIGIKRSKQRMATAIANMP